jgi:hypothetical protein
MIYSEPLELGFAVPINGALIGQVYLSSNGWVSASRPQSTSAWADCLPVTTLPPGTLAPFWADLDPSQGGTVRAGPAAPGIYVVSYENVPRWEEAPGPDTPAYTFQIVFYSTGDVEYRYGAMGAPPERWSVGMAFDPQRGQRLACHKSPVDLGGKLWRMRNQPLPAIWLGVAPGAVWVPPGEAATFTVTLQGFGFAGWHPAPFVGPLALTTNDPHRPSVTLTATASVGPAPFTRWLAPVFR